MGIATQQTLANRRYCRCGAHRHLISPPWDMHEFLWVLLPLWRRMGRRGTCTNSSNDLDSATTQLNSCRQGSTSRLQLVQGAIEEGLRTHLARDLESTSRVEG